MVRLRWFGKMVVCFVFLSVLCGLAAPSPAEYRLGVGAKVLEAWLSFEECLRRGDKAGLEKGKSELQEINLGGLRPIDRSVYREVLAQVEMLGLGLADREKELIFLDQLLVSLVSLWGLDPSQLTEAKLSLKVRQLGETQIESFQRKWSLPKNLSLLHLEGHLALRVVLLSGLDSNDLYVRDQVKMAIFTLLSCPRPTYFRSFDKTMLSYLGALDYRDEESAALFRAWAIDLLFEARDKFCPDFGTEFSRLNQKLEDLSLAPVPDFI